MNQTYNPYDNVLQVVQQALIFLATATAISKPLSIRKENSKSPFRFGWTTEQPTYSRATESNIPLPADLQKAESVSIQT